MIDSLIRRYRVTSFFMLAIAMTWTAFIPFYLDGGEGPALFTFGPFVAAMIVSAIVGGWPSARALLRSIVHWRVAPIWYLVAVGFPIAVQLLANWLNPAFGSGPANWAAIPPVGQIAATVAVLAVFSGPLGEEPGWRGFALPELLQKHAAVIGAGKDLDSPEGKQLNEDLQAYRPKNPDQDLLTSGPFRYDFTSITNAQLSLVKEREGVRGGQGRL